MDAELRAAIERLNVLFRAGGARLVDHDARSAWNTVRSQLTALDSAARRVVDNDAAGATLSRQAKDMAELARIVEGQG